MRGVVKRFGEIVAVDGLDLEVPPGVCFGLLGPNGAGKSTTMRMLTAQTLADEGEIAVLGYELPRESKQSRLEMGVVPQLDNLDVELTCRQILTVFARLYRIPRARARGGGARGRSRSRTCVPRADTIVRELSGGMRRRLLVARGLIHRPRLVLLDEPTVGLDPQVRQELWSLIDGLRADGVTVLMSTHYIEEAERLADTVAVMSAGRDHRAGHAGGAGARARGRAGARGLRPAGAPGARSSELAAEQRLAEPAQRPGGGDHARGDARRPGAGGRAPPGEPRGRVRGADRRGDRMSGRVRTADGAHAGGAGASAHDASGAWNRRRWRA